LAIATHGRGIFYARIFQKGAVLSNETVAPISSVKVYPNPAVSELNIASSGPIAGVSIYTIDGKKVALPEIVLGATSLKISLGEVNLTPGLYFVIVTSEGQKSWHKVVVE
jgi:hypothetical protein